MRLMTRLRGVAVVFAWCSLPIQPVALPGAQAAAQVFV
jgi:hypothetical protein